MILREIVQDVGVDRVLAEYRLILFEAKALQPTSDVHDGALLQPGAHYLSTPMRVMRCWVPAASGHAADQRDELAPLHVCAHSITSSARASSVGGILRPSAFRGIEVDHQLVL